MLDQHPPHIKRRIALGITVGVAVILFTLLILIYTSDKKATVDNGSGSALSNFYNTILRTGQSYFGGN